MALCRFLHKQKLCRLLSTSPQHNLTQADISKFNKNGFLVLDSFWTRQTCNNLIKRMNEIVDSWDPKTTQSIFSTRNQEKTSDDYFLGSGDKISFFLEEGAVDEDGKLTKPKGFALNKVGHAVHDLDHLFRESVYQSRVCSIAHQVGLERPVAVQSMYIFKQPGIGGEVRPHQDGTFLYTEPQSVVGFWWALEDCTKDNGCLWAIPGSHKHGLKERFCRKADGKGTELIDPIPELAAACPDADPNLDPWDISRGEPIECPAGTLVLLHNKLVHYSMENKSDVSRHAFSIHVVDNRQGCKYPRNNWLQRHGTIPFFALEPITGPFSPESESRGYWHEENGSKTWRVPVELQYN